MFAIASNTVVCMGGQGARRKRNWRHNRPNSPYNLARIAALGGGLCPAQQAQLEQQRREAEAQRAEAEQKQADDGDGKDDC
jgi:hypothetical protein